MRTGLPRWGVTGARWRNAEGLGGTIGGACTLTRHYGGHRGSSALLRGQVQGGYTLTRRGSVSASSRLLSASLGGGPVRDRTPSRPSWYALSLRHRVRPARSAATLPASFSSSPSTSSSPWLHQLAKRRLHDGVEKEPEDAQFADRSEGLSDEQREQVLAGALAHVHRYGWTAETLALAAREQGLSPVAHGLFPRGPVELVEYFLEKCNDAMLAELGKLDLEQMTLKEKIKAAIQARLKQYTSYIPNWPQAIAVLAQPHNAATSLSLMLNTINDIIYIAGDSTVDFDWYSKRAVLAGVYTSTELYMLTDASDNFADTWAFLDRRLDDVVTLSKYKAECETLASLAIGYFGAIIGKTMPSSSPHHHATTPESPAQSPQSPAHAPSPPPPPNGPFSPTAHDDITAPPQA